MTYYSDCGWAPFGWTSKEADVENLCLHGTVWQEDGCALAENFAECPEGMTPSDSKCTMNEDVCGQGTTLVDGKCEALVDYYHAMQGFGAAALFTLCKLDSQTSTSCGTVVATMTQIHDFSEIENHCKTATGLDNNTACELEMMYRAHVLRDLHAICKEEPDREDVYVKHAYLRNADYTFSCENNRHVYDEQWYYANISSLDSY